jgi:hypothetical protein
MSYLLNGDDDTSCNIARNTGCSNYDAADMLVKVSRTGLVQRLRRPFAMLYCENPLWPVLELRYFFREGSMSRVSAPHVQHFGDCLHKRRRYQDRCSVSQRYAEAVDVSENLTRQIAEKLRTLLACSRSASFKFLNTSGSLCSTSSSYQFWLLDPHPFKLWARSDGRGFW